MKVVLTETAKSSLREIIDYLAVNWTAKEVDTLKYDIKKFEQSVQDGIIIHAAVERFPETKFALLATGRLRFF